MTATTLTYGHSDRPLATLAEDSLGLRPYAEGLAEFIRHCATPFTVAVQGDWGTGKTSLMRMVEDALRAQAGGERIETVRFQTWQYSQFGATSALPAPIDQRPWWASTSGSRGIALQRRRDRARRCRPDQLSRPGLRGGQSASLLHWGHLGRCCSKAGMQLRPPRNLAPARRRP